MRPFLLCLAAFSPVWASPWLACSKMFFLRTRAKRPSTTRVQDSKPFTVGLLGALDGSDTSRTRVALDDYVDWVHQGRRTTTALQADMKRSSERASISRASPSIRSFSQAPSTSPTYVTFASPTSLATAPRRTPSATPSTIPIPRPSPPAAST